MIFLLQEASIYFTINQKHRWFLIQIAFEAFPLADALADDLFVVASDVGGDAEHRVGMQVFAEVL